MLYKKKTVDVRPQRIASAPVVEHNNVERETIVEHDGWSPEATAMTIIGGLILFGLLLYFLWYRPTYVESAPAPTTVEHRIDINNPAPSPSTIVTPPPVVNTPAPSNPIIVNPPANNNTPPVHIDNNVTTPPAGGANGSGTDNTGTDNSGTTNP